MKPTPMHAEEPGTLPCITARALHHAVHSTRRMLTALVALAVAACSLPALAAIPLSERQVLIDLYNSTGGDSWTRPHNWKTAGAFSSPGTECTWAGVRCDPAGEHVNALDLTNNQLVGTLPGSLNGLAALETFWANANRLTGAIPSLGSWPSLKRFEVGTNQLTGAIPSLDGLLALEHFVANNNQLTGPIPSLDALTALVVFNVNDNQLSGAIPGLAALTELAGFRAANNQLTGLIPGLATLTRLEVLEIYNNQLTGPIPDLSTQTTLYSVLVSHNRLTGVPPAAPGTLQSGRSSLCPNLLRQPSPTEARWDNASPTGSWSAGCTAGYLVSPSAGPGGSVSGPEGVLAGATATVTIAPDAGRSIAAIASTCGGTQTGTSFTTGAVHADCTVAVTFSAVATPVPTLGHEALLGLGALLAVAGLRRVRQRA